MIKLKGFGNHYLEFYFEELKEVKMHLKQRFELYKDSYIVLNINQEYIKLLENQNSYFQFYDYNENILKSLYNKI